MSLLSGPFSEEVLSEAEKIESDKALFVSVMV